MVRSSLVAGVEHGAVVALAEEAAQLAVSAVGIFVDEVHGELPCLDDGLFAAFGREFLLLDAVALADGCADVVRGEFLFLQVDGPCHDALGELQVYLAVVHHGIGHDGIDDALQLAHAAFHILGDILHHFLRYDEAVLADFGDEDVAAQLRVFPFPI